LAEEVALEKALPHSLDAERTVLGAILIENESFHHASEILKRDDFYRQAHQKIFARMESLSVRGQGIDLVTLKEELARAGELESAGGIGYLTSLVDGVPRADERRRGLREVLRTDAATRTAAHRAPASRVPRLGPRGARAAPGPPLDARRRRRDEARRRVLR